MEIDDLTDENVLENASEAFNKAMSKPDQFGLDFSLFKEDAWM
jgi:hypothetical protein